MLFKLLQIPIQKEVKVQMPFFFWKKKKHVLHKNAWITKAMMNFVDYDT